MTPQHKKKLVKKQKIAKPLAKPRAKKNQSKPHIFALANQKGGVGKTTTAINLSTALASIGKKILLIDLDPQGNASTSFGLSVGARHLTSFEVLTGKASISHALVETQIEGLDILPSSLELTTIERVLGGKKNRLLRLKTAIKDLDIIYDYIFIDCPPSLNLSTFNGLVACTSVLVPLQCEFFALEGLSQLLQTIKEVETSLNPNIHMRGIILTMYDYRNNLSAQVEKDVRKHFKDKVYRTVIPRNVRLSEAPSFGKPALLYDYKCAGSLAYMKLATELLRQEKQIKR